MHPTAFDYVKGAQSRHAFPYRANRPLRVLELGSRRDACGGEWIRRAFPGSAQWIGVDIRAGHGVDVVADAITYRGEGLAPPDVVLCCEVLEHAPRWPAILANAAELVRAGGVLIVTCAAPERAPHSVDGGALPEGEHYAAPDALKLRATFTACELDVLELVHDPDAGDLYAVAARRPELVPELVRSELLNGS